MLSSTEAEILFYRGLLLSLLLSLVAILIRASMELAPAASGLGPMVLAATEPGGTISPVTAALLIFRDYDTLLELTVLLLALIGAWSLGKLPPRHPAKPLDPILLDFLRLLLPLILLISLYLVWAGGSAAGGAFQGGAMLSTIGILLILSNRRGIVLSLGMWLRLAATLGLIVFLIAGITPIIMGHPFLAASPEWMKAKILWLEFPAALSIGIILTALFAGGQPLNSKKP